MLSGALLVKQQVQELRALRHHELVTDTYMNNVSNIVFTYTHVADTPMNDGANFSLNDTNKHSPEEEWGDMIGEGSIDNVERSISDEWGHVIEETNAQFCMGMMLMLPQNEVYRTTIMFTLTKGISFLTI